MVTATIHLCTFNSFCRWTHAHVGRMVNNTGKSMAPVVDLDCVSHLSHALVRSVSARRPFRLSRLLPHLPALCDCWNCTPSRVYTRIAALLPKNRIASIRRQIA